jgi:hypothetical protein
VLPCRRLFMLEAILPLIVVGPDWFAMTLGSGREVAGFSFLGGKWLKRREKKKVEGL